MKKLCIVLAVVTVIFSSCSSIFSGGTGGLVVDAESTSTPKAGIANVDVYAYMDRDDRNSDYNSWREGTKFSPSSDYYGHTTTASDGSFTISKLVWETKPGESKFGKDADYTNVYLLFFHENYGLTKGETIIISDSSSDTVYAELTSVRKTTTLNFNFEDVSTGTNTNETVFVKISVPQTTEANTKATPKVYQGNYIGAGTVSVSYPRWQNKADRSAGIETTPEITITYEQSTDQITWAGCYNGDSPSGDYDFRSDASTGIKKIIKNPSYNMTFYGKATKLSMPLISGQYEDTKTTSDDGVVISLRRKDSSGAYTIDCGQVTTTAQTLGSNGTEKHGVFNNLGEGYTWFDDSYTGKFATVDVEIYAKGTPKGQFTLRSNEGNFNVQL